MLSNVRAMLPCASPRHTLKNSLGAFADGDGETWAVSRKDSKQCSSLHLAEIQAMKLLHSLHSLAGA